MPDLLSNMNERELDLFDAFKAGFDASGEGFNGEYVSDRFCGRDNEEFQQRMLEDFREWRNA